ncbi:DgyrCDS11920 [Dimorphilus gyrociliatus]|uniref:DgyrCDS11920 n=1 Tax=Dimorphilus gyrociliatus TaxID=2664684 RepID=A0A7I8W4V1_9ANNE|nr:DgyrCDS11920 [Dimorphilus gyrociliatus]
MTEQNSSQQPIKRTYWRIENDQKLERRLQADFVHVPNYGIAIYAYILHPAKRFDCFHFAERNRLYLCEHLRNIVAEQSGITPMFVDLFGLFHLDLKTLVPLGEKLQCGSDITNEYVLRMACRPLQLDYLFSSTYKDTADTGATQYIFLQCRDDYMEDRVNFNNKLIRDTAKNWATLIASCFPEQKIRNAKDIDPLVAQQKFVTELFRLAPDYGCYIAKGRESPNGVSYQVVVDANHASNPGICVYTRWHRTQSHLLRYVGPLESITDVNVKYESDMAMAVMTIFTDQVSPNGEKATKLFFDAELIAYGFAAAIYMYYRMSVSFHIKELVFPPSIGSPMLDALSMWHCHGPITEEFAKKRMIHEKSKGYYIVFQHCTIWYRFHLHFWHVYEGGLDIRRAEIQYDRWKKQFYLDSLFSESGRMIHISRQPAFDTLGRLVDSYKKQRHLSHSALKVKRSIRPIERPIKSSLGLISGLELCMAPSPLPSFINHQAYQIPSELLLVKNSLGKGLYTEVLRAELKKELSDHVALKRVLFPEESSLESSKEMEQHLQATATVIQNWNHPNLIRFYGVSHMSSLCIVMEYCPFGSLMTFFSYRPKLFLEHLVAICSQILYAFRYLDKMGSIHGNIHAGNVMVSKYNRQTGDVLVKVTDPGVVTYADEQSLVDSSNLGRLPWLAPELFSELSSVSSKSDMYAVGTTLWQVLTAGDLPICEDSPDVLLKQLSKKKFLPIPENCSVNNGTAPIYMDLMRGCWKFRSEDRLTPSQSLVIMHKVSENLQRRTFCVKYPSNIETTSPSLLGIKNKHSLGLVSSSAKRIIPTDLFRNATDIELDNDTALGEGFFCQVFKGFLNDHASKIPCAVKVLKTAREDDLEELLEEVSILAHLSHQNIVKVLAMVDSRQTADGTVMLVMEFMAGGSLLSDLHRLRDSGSHMDYIKLLKYCYQISYGLDYLHRCDVIHRDLAARNILLTADKDICKISDFGLSRILDETDYYTLSHSQKFPILWTAPEAMETSKFTRKNDMWAMGVTMWEVFTLGDKPRHGLLPEPLEKGVRMKTLVLRKLKSGDRLPRHRGNISIPNDIYTCIRECWHLTPQSRPTALELANMISGLLDRYDEPYTMRVGRKTGSVMM